GMPPHMPRWFRRRCIAVLLLALAARALPAQQLRVVLTDSASSARVIGAIVTVLDGNGVPVAERLSDAAGSLAVRLPGPDSYRVRVRRIGRAPVLSAPRRIDADETAVVELTLASARRTLPTATVTADAGAVCGRSPDPDDRVGVLWDQVTTALRSAVLAREDSVASPMLRVREFVRTIGQAGNVVDAVLTSDERRRGRAFTAASADSLARHGFVRRGSDGGFVFHAPDEAVLVSAAFARTHCFSAPASDSGSAFVELRFRPAPGVRRPDVMGSIWIDSASGEPRRIEYRYVVPKRFLPAPATGAGGSVELMRLVNETWVVSHWLIRMPLWGETDSGTRVIVAGWREVLGEALPVDERLIRPADLPEARGVALQLTVEDDAGQPAVGALVSLDAGDSFTRTDTLGRARLIVVDTGTFAIHVRRMGLAPLDTALALLQYGTDARTVRLRRVQTLASVNIAAAGPLVNVGFHRRRQVGMGYFMDITQLRQRAAMNALQLLQNFPQLELYTVPMTNDSVPRRLDPEIAALWVPGLVFPIVRTNTNLRGEGGWCVPLILIDDRLTSPLELRALRSDEIIAFEYYPRRTTVPAEYRRSRFGDECGAILLWTAQLSR
nr:carboxypeptidase-like regulatory domain-containing protein [Gemmatimonadaceae bacterium]